MNNRIMVQILLGMAVLPIITGCGADEDVTSLKPLQAVESQSEGASRIDVSEESVEPVRKTVKVYVCGAVGRPGVYELLPEHRIADAIVSAGDFTAEADADYLNLAEYLKDGSRIYVPTVDETEAMTDSTVGGTSGAMVSDELMSDDARLNPSGIDLNHATLQELKTLSGIGDVKAAAIIAYREQNGGFRSIEQLLEVDGIKQGLYERIKEHVCVRE